MFVLLYLWQNNVSLDVDLLTMRFMLNSCLKWWNLFDLSLEWNEFWTFLSLQKLQQLNFTTLFTVWHQLLWTLYGQRVYLTFKEILQRNKGLFYFPAVLNIKKSLFYLSHLLFHQFVASPFRARSCVLAQRVFYEPLIALSLPTVAHL